MTYLPRRIQPPFTLYTLHAEPDTMNSPPVPAVLLIEEESETGHRHKTTHTLTPEQARDLASELTRAADAAERGSSEPMRIEAAVAMARGDHAAATSLARTVTTRHVSPAVREHLVERVVDAVKHWRALERNGVDVDSDVWLDQVGQMRDQADRLIEFDVAIRAGVAS